MTPRQRQLVAQALADAFLAGEWATGPLVERGRTVLGARRRWLGPLVRAVLGAYRDPPADRPRELAGFIAASPVFQAAVTRAEAAGRPIPVRRRLLPVVRMGRARWPVPPIDDVAALAALTGLDIGDLEWLADVRNMERRVAAEALRNYRYTWLPKRSGGARLIEAPKPRLAAVQRRLLHDVLHLVPTHPAVHGFVPGRSPLTHGRLHVGSAFVLRLDLEAFFSSVSAGRVYGIFRTAGYPEPVAHLLTGLTTNLTPPAIRRAAPVRDLGTAQRLRADLARPHLPQGASTSPALANLSAYRLDRRLAALAEGWGIRYTRYADDLIFSGDRQLTWGAGRLVGTVRSVAAEEGFRINDDKTRLRGRGGRQAITGLVVNDRVNVPREEYDRLRAIVHNAARYGPASQNRTGHPDFRNHLLGRISWVAATNPDRGARLRAAFDRITW